MAMHTEDTRERILAAARRLFHERSYASTGIAEICREARVVKGSFYHFFPSKEELLAETITRNWAQLDALLDNLEADPRPGRDCIGALFKGICGESRRTLADCGKILGCRIGTISSEIGIRESAAQERSIAAFDGWRRSLKRLVRRGQRDGSIDPDLDPATAADALLALIQGMSVLGRALHQPAVLKRIAAAAMLQIPRPG